MDGNTAQNQQRTSQPQSHANLIRADQVHRLPHLDDEQKTKYEQGVKNLWEVIDSRPQNSLEHQQAYTKLVQVSQNIKNTLGRWRAQNQTQQQGAANQDSLGGQNNASRAQIQGQQGQPEASQASGTALPQSVPQMPPQVNQHGQSLPFIVPPNVVAAGPTQAADWLRQATSKYSKALQSVDFASSQLKELANMTAQRQREGRSFSPEEFQKLQTRKAQLSKMYSDNKEILAQFKHQQDSLRAQQNPQQSMVSSAGAGQNDGAHANQGSHHSPATTGQQPIHQHLPPGHGAPHTVNSAIDAARSQANAPPHPSMSPSNAGQQHSGQIPTSQSGSAVPGQPQLPQQPLNINTSSSAPQQTNSPQTAQPNSAIQGPPRPLSHQMAMAQAARSYSNSNFQQSIPQSAGLHTHLQIGNVEQTNNNTKMRIPKKLDISEPQPVAMGPARPTMSGGPSNGAMGMMGQPAIPKHPGFVLEGEGERVLSKKKLDELVRQVTGGGEGIGGEGLSAEVEEVSYRGRFVIYLGSLQVDVSPPRRVPEHLSVSRVCL